MFHTLKITVFIFCDGVGKQGVNKETDFKKKKKTATTVIELCLPCYLHFHPFSPTERLC